METVTDNNSPTKECPECGSTRGHKMSCERGNELAARRQGVDLDRLRPVSIAKVAQGPDKEWDAKAKAPEDWWAKNGDQNWSVRHAAREGWYACAKSLGVYDD